MRRREVDPIEPAGQILDEAVAVLTRGGIVAFPTDTLYGLAVDPFDVRAVERLFGVKGRAAEQAVALVAADVAQVERWLGPMIPTTRRLAERFWPGPLTILVKAPLKRSPYDRSAKASAERDARPLAPGIAAADGSVGVRVPDHEVARALCRACGQPLTATSANLTGEAATADPDVVARTLAARIDLLLDAGRTSGGPPSTIVDATGSELRLVRAGAISWSTIQLCVRDE